MDFSQYENHFIDLHETKFAEFIAEGMTEDEASEEADRVCEEEMDELREMKRCCPNGCRGYC